MNWCERREILYSIVVETGSQWRQWRFEVMFVHSHQYPSCNILDIVEPLQNLSRKPNEKCVRSLQVTKAWARFF